MDSIAVGKDDVNSGVGSMWISNIFYLQFYLLNRYDFKAYTIIHLYTICHKRRYQHLPVFLFDLEIFLKYQLAAMADCVHHAGNQCRSLLLCFSLTLQHYLV